MSSSILRAAPAIALLTVMAACSPKTPKTEEAAASSAPVAAAPAEAPTHRWVFNRGTDYGYVSAHPDTTEGAAPETPTLVRYLGEQDGVYAIAEVENGVIVVASCSKPCETVRLRGQDLDQTMPLHPDSIVAAALHDAMAGNLAVYVPPPASKPAQAAKPRQ